MGTIVSKILMAMGHRTSKKLVDIEKSLSESRVVYASDDTIAPTTYSALSYVWAKTLPASKHAGVKWDVSAFKEKNMKEVLRIVRDCNVKFLWLDAYCIDQSSEVEKGREIPRMGSYYSDAASVFILPNGVDNIYEDSIIFDKWRRHWCLWTQRVWTVPELSLAKKAMVICCLRKDQGQRVRSIIKKDLGKQLFPIKIDHHFPLQDDKEIIVTDIEGYCRAVELKASGYLDGKSDSHDIDYDDPSELTQRLLGFCRERNQSINQWIHQIVRRHCKYDRDRVHAMLPALNMNLAFVNTSDDLNGSLATVFERGDIHVLGQLMLATRTRGDESQEQEMYQTNNRRTAMTIYPMLKMVELAEGEGEMLVHIEEEIHFDNGISKSFDKNKGLVLKDVIITKPVTVRRFIYEGEEYINDDGKPTFGDDIFGNIPYELDDDHLPYCVGKCNIGVVELVRLGTSGVSIADKWRMRGMEALTDIKAETLICCLACSRYPTTSNCSMLYSTNNEFLEKVGVLLVEEGRFNNIPSFRGTITLK